MTWLKLLLYQTYFNRVKGSPVAVPLMFLNSFGNRAHLHLEGCPVYLESPTPGGETQLYHLPWTDPGCTGTRRSSGNTCSKLMTPSCGLIQKKMLLFEKQKKYLKYFWKLILPLNKVRSRDLHRNKMLRQFVRSQWVWSTKSHLHIYQVVRNTHKLS